jgi:hypothetical protein
MTATFPVYGHDADVAAWAFHSWGCRPFHIDVAVGVASAETGRLVGAFAFSGYNGTEAEVHFFGPGTLSRHILREIFSTALRVLDLHRMVVRTRKASVARGVKKLGAMHEGSQRCVYGPSQGDEHKAECYAFFRDRIEALAETKGL